MVKIIENYTLHQQIGEGQYGKVYRGVDGKSGKEVAAKVVNAKRFKQNPKLEECTLNEIEVLSRIDSPHIVRFIEILKTVNNFYFFYEYCNGGTLDQEIRRQGCLSEAKVLAYLQQLLQAFRVLAASNIMHRDLKPSNILLHNGVLKLGDFGFCKSLESHRDLAQTMLGSPIYMAPEVLRGEIYTIKADIWSLGVVLYEMTFGFCPFQESSIARLISALDTQQLQFNRQLNPISPQLQELFRLILVKDHFKRISWDQLFAYSFKGGKISKANTHTHHRALSETNRILRKDSNCEKDAKTAAIVGVVGVGTQNRFLKKKGSALEEVEARTQQAHSNIREMIKLIDRCIQVNAFPEITCVVALKLYRIALKAHNRLGSRKEYLKERFQLTEAINAVSSLLESEEKETQILNTFSSSSKHEQTMPGFMAFLKAETDDGSSARQLQKCLTEANLL